MELHRLVRQRLESLPNSETTDAPESDFDRRHIENQVWEELGSHVKDGSYSQLFFEQMVSLYGNGFVSIGGKKFCFSVLDIGDMLDAICAGTTIGRPLNHRGSRLTGLDLLHTHQSRTYCINFNILRFFDRNYTNDFPLQSKLQEILNRSEVTFDEAINALITSIIMESLNSVDKTGQWLIFKKLHNGFHFVALHFHDGEDKSDELLFEIIKDHLDPCSRKGFMDGIAP